ncbi:MAG: twin-arginine translocase TatA/TatE family subunit [Thermoleophilaceae bacterium]|jgi:sec-independent protein translocase protein TatA
MPGFIGIPELLILFVVLLLVFGPKRIPEMGRSLGRGMREFKESITGRIELEPAEAVGPEPAQRVPERANQ